MPVKYKLGTGDVLDITAVTKNNQGAGSGLDSDFLDGLHGSAYEKIANKGVANGYAPLGADSKVPSSYLPVLALTDVYTVASEAAQLALVAEEGDIAIRTDINKSYAHNGGTSGTMADWSELLSPTAAVSSVFGRTGAVVAAINDYTWAQIDKTISSLADITTKSHTVLSDIGTNTHAQIDTHLGAVSPHSGHELIASKDQANGYPGLSAGSKIAGTQITYGTAVDTACVGNDSRLSDARTPTGVAGGDLADTYPNPTVALLAITDAKVATANKDGLVGTFSMRTLGTGAQQACAGNDSRLSDARTPTAHASTHNGGADAVTPSGIGAIAVPGSSAWGDILFRDTSGWTRLPAGTSGLFLKTQGAGADPIWASGAGGASTFLDLTDTPSSYTGQAKKVLRVNAGATAVEFVNELELNKLGVGIPDFASALTNIEGDSTTYGAILRLKDTKATPGGQPVLTFFNSSSNIFQLDNLGDLTLGRWLDWASNNTAKYGRLTNPPSDGVLGIFSQGTDANIDFEIRPKGTGVLRLGGASGAEIDTSGYIKPINVSLPTADSTYRGKIARVQGASGVVDKLYACRKKADETYEWELLNIKAHTFYFGTHAPDGGAVLTAGSTLYLGAMGHNATEAIARSVIPFVCTITEVRVALYQVPTGTESVTFTVIKNGTATSMTFTISGSNADGNTTANPVTLSSADKVSVKAVASAGCASTAVKGVLTLEVQ